MKPTCLSPVVVVSLVRWIREMVSSPARSKYSPGVTDVNGEADQRIGVPCSRFLSYFDNPDYAIVSARARPVKTKMELGSCIAAAHGIKLLLAKAKSSGTRADLYSRWLEIQPRHMDDH